VLSINVLPNCIAQHIQQTAKEIKILITGCAVAQALCYRRHFIPMGASRDFLTFSPTALEVRPSTDFHAKWLNRRGFTQGCAFCSKNRNFSYPL